jgi:transposase-like protein
VLAFWPLPPRQWRKPWSTNLLERMNEAIKRRSRPIGILLDNAAITRLVGASGAAGAGRAKEAGAVRRFLCSGMATRHCGLFTL